jgi:hypothetical protein
MKSEPASAVIHPPPIFLLLKRAGRAGSHHSLTPLKPLPQFVELARPPEMKEEYHSPASTCFCNKYAVCMIGKGYIM